MKERIRKVRNYLGLNQKDFSKKINIGSSTLAMIETGQRAIKDIHISQICSEFNVNEDWLRTGEGEMFKGSDEVIIKEDYLLKLFNMLPEVEKNSTLDFVEYLVSRKVSHLNEGSAKRNQLLKEMMNFLSSLPTEYLSSLTWIFGGMEIFLEEDSKKQDELIQKWMRVSY